MTAKKVCVIGSGYLIDHEDLPSDASAADGNSIADNSGCNYHGSHCAGTIDVIDGNGVGVIGVFPGAPDMKIAHDASEWNHRKYFLP